MSCTLLPTRAARAAEERTYRWVVLGAATFAQISACFLIQGMGTLAPYMQRALNLRVSEIGLLISAAQLVPLVGLLVAGELLDRFGERLTVGVGSLAIAVALTRAAAASSYGSLLAWFIVVGAGYSAVQPGGSKLVSQWFATSERGLALGIRQAGLPIGGALAAAVFPAVVSARGWQAAFRLGAAVAFLGGALFIVLDRSPNAGRPRMGISRRPALSARLSILRNPGMPKIMWSGMTLISAQYGVLVFFTLYLRDRFSISVVIASRLLGLALLAGAAGRVVLAAWGDRSKAGRYLPVVTSMWAVAGGLLALLSSLSGSPWLLAIIAACLGFFGFGWYGPWIAYVTELAPRDRIGFGIGLAMTINQIMIVVSPPALGLLRDFTGSYTAAWFMLSGMLVVAALITTTIPFVSRAANRRITASTNLVVQFIKDWNDTC